MEFSLNLLVSDLKGLAVLVVTKTHCHGQEKDYFCEKYFCKHY